jgi:NADPH2:quinone reductase
MPVNASTDDHDHDLQGERVRFTGGTQGLRAAAGVKEFTAGRGADVVFDPVGGDAYTGSTKCIAFEGRIIIVGFAGGTIPAPALNHVLVKNYSIVGLHWGLYKAHNQQLIDDCHTELTRLADSGAIMPLVSERLSFADVADGVERLGSGNTVGRLVFQR